MYNVDKEGKSIYTIHIEQKMYELTGFISHEGGESLQSGHYTFVAVDAPYETTGLAFLCSDADEPKPITDVANCFARSYIQVSQPLFSKKNSRSLKIFIPSSGGVWERRRTKRTSQLSCFQDLPSSFRWTFLLFHSLSQGLVPHRL